MLLEGKSLAFYEWEGDVNGLLDGVRRSINGLAEGWSREQKDHCLQETEASFKARYRPAPRCSTVPRCRRRSSSSSCRAEGGECGAAGRRPVARPSCAPLPFARSRPAPPFAPAAVLGSHHELHVGHALTRRSHQLSVSGRARESERNRVASGEGGVVPTRPAHYVRAVAATRRP